MSKTKISRGGTPQGSSTGRFTNRAIRLTVPVLAIAGWLAAIAPGIAITARYNNDYRVCAGRILTNTEGVNTQAISEACATSLRPRDLATCVVDIKKKTQIVATDALSYCSQARRPLDYGYCVVNISQNTQNAINPAVLNYCGRSLLPTRFAQCVVGLRGEIKELEPTPALDTCIDGSDRIGGLTPSSTLSPSQSPTESSPNVETNPLPVIPGSQ
ncbi:hypothetical protein [Amazonocrinis nigriterrae]|uniref:hypothetical protein n=1 Tax=Amazonocrinis nigriterrae TaxID=2840443 RepID=UPI001CEDB5B1|nr:hypothetical protein [Amazonocrinis nigriterrae]